MNEEIKTFSDHNWDCLHDVIIDSIGLNFDRVQCIDLYLNLPTAIKEEAKRWGLSDTVVRDKIYTYLENNYEV